MRHLAVLAATVAVFAAPALAQEGARAALDEIRVGFYDLGALLVVPAPRFTGDVGALGTVRIQSGPDAANVWAVSFADVEMVAEPGGAITARPIGPIRLRLGPPGPQERVYSINAPGLEARLATPGTGEEVGRWSIAAPRIEAQMDGGAWRASAQGLRYEGGEKDRVYIEHHLRADALALHDRGLVAHGGAALDLTTGSIDARLDLQSGGYLENQPWMAAVAAGMGAKAVLEARDIEATQGEPDGAGLRPETSLGADRVALSATQKREATSAEWTITGVSWEDVAAAGARVRLTNGQARGALTAPLHATAAPIPVKLSASAFGEFARDGAKTWPWEARVDLDGSARLPVEWYGFNPIEGVGSWRPFWTILDPTALVVRDLGLDIAGGGIKANGELDGQSGGLVGQITVATTGMEGPLDFVGHSGLFTAEQATIAADLVAALFGTTGPARIALDFTGKAVEMDGAPIWAPGP